MKADPRNFATAMNLECKVTCGLRKSVGRALHIDSRMLTLKLPPFVSKPPKVLEMMTLEIPLFNGGKRDKCLRIRGWATRIASMPNGEKYVEVRIRTAAFRDVSRSGGSRA